MDLDEIEEKYQKELEKAENDFLKEVAGSKDSSAAEKKYTERVKAAQSSYSNAVNSVLAKQKGSLGKVEKKKTLEKNEQFKVVPGNFELTRWEKQKIKWGLFFFKTHFKVRNDLRKKTPNFVSYQYYYWRILIRRFTGAVRDEIHHIVSEITLAMQHNYETLSEFMKKAFKFLWELPGKFLSHFKKKGKEEKKEETKTS